jgi:hypothetical protein
MGVLPLLWPFDVAQIVSPLAAKERAAEINRKA